MSSINLTIDNKLLEAGLKKTRLKSPNELVEMALRELLRRSTKVRLGFKPALQKLSQLDNITWEKNQGDGHPVKLDQPIITSSPDVMGGTPVFAGTRVPVQTFLDYIKGGDSINDFLEGFPTVSKEQVIAFIKETEEKLISKIL
ncbi:hypothetical protein PN36_33185 [Candidatus Thiomargarita nelsonii]|uniref:DUF433 domain-containing protein n=1 Tax=Candidatus Thiomargarita nelsonii TaxID=1003181 RepID=A0A4E0QNG5_9GAMM|nr:hypothetical protein PN36_33185 [Candidatus Thiomargarita nelsonii]